MCLFFGVLFFSSFSAAILRNVVKIIMLIIDVGLVLVRLVNGFFGIKDKISCGMFRLEILLI